jgi:hypothetical protein
MVDPLDGRVDIAPVVTRQRVKQVREAEYRVERGPEVVARLAHGIRRHARSAIPVADWPCSREVPESPIKWLTGVHSTLSRWPERAP